MLKYKKIYYLIMSELVDMVELFDVLLTAVSVGCYIMGDMEKGKIKFKNGDDPVTQVFIF